MLADFRKFIMQGNVLDLAVAVVIGAAFGAVVNSFVDNIILQFIGGVFGQPNFDSVGVIQNDDGTAVYLRIGAFITSLVNFLIIAAAIFVVVRSFEELQARRSKGQEPEPEPLTTDQELLAEIRDLLRDKA